MGIYSEEKMERKKKRNGCGRGLTGSVDSDCIPYLVAEPEKAV